MGKNTICAIDEHSTWFQWCVGRQPNGSVDNVGDIIATLNTLRVRCATGEPQNVVIAGKNGGVEATISAYKAIRKKGTSASIAALETLVALLTGRYAYD